MGNQLVGVAPSQIFPVEYYLTDHAELQFDVSLGSTRFFKVARAKYIEGLIVVKVFAIHDPSLPLQTYRERLENIREKLSTTVNCLPFQRIELTERAGLIMRQYVKHSLYDRISTRPFLTVIEKKWITFQILYSLHQCHKLQICHGDIKLENILVTSWNWILLADFASFKPTYLPDDNPADYSYFFDTSRRRTCYIAPERFVKTLSMENVHKDGFLVNEIPCSSGDLLPSMDIFSAGCALLELWNEGTPPFELSQLLAYRAGDYEPRKHLDSIKDPALKTLLSSMIELDPNLRLSAEVYLDNEKGRFFPEYFYSFLQSYMLIFSATPILPPDEKIMRLYQDIEYIISIFNEENKNKYDRDITPTQSSVKEEIKSSSDNDGLIIITSLVTSCIRGLHHCMSKMNCLDILLQLAAHTSSETILDRILPYILHLAQDPAARVRVYSLDILARCLDLVQELPRSDFNVFPEYVLPAIAPLAIDTAVVVRIAYAKNIASLAETALRFLDMATRTAADKDCAVLNYENELSALHDMVQQTVAHLLTDTHSLVKQTLMESGLARLCVFFGKQKANDVLLSHMITFLNDKCDKNLRGSFFDSVVEVAAYVGWHCSIILAPLLHQGLTDTSEFVIAKSIHATASLMSLGLLHKSTLTEYIAECACYLNHPNLWIRHEVCGLIATSARLLSPIDVQCKIVPAISVHLRVPLLQVEKPEMLLDSLQPPVPRTIFDSVVRYPDINYLIETLRERRVIRAKVKQGTVPLYGEMNQALKALFNRLQSEGLTDHIENQLLSMSAHLIKLSKYRIIDNSNLSNKSPDKLNQGSIGQYNGRLDIRGTPNLSHVLQLDSTKTENPDIMQRKPRKPAEDITMNLEWQHMFGGLNSPGVQNNQTNTSHSGNTNSLSNLVNISPSHNQTSNMNDTTSLSEPEGSFIQCRLADCSMELRSLVVRQQERYDTAKHALTLAESARWRSPLPPPGWTPRGRLIAHLHEHTGAITGLIPLSPESPLFVTASLDGTAKLWDAKSMEGQNVANRSKQLFTPRIGPLTFVASLESGRTLAFASRDGQLLATRVDVSPRYTSLISGANGSSHDQACANAAADDSAAVAACVTQRGAGSVLVYATLYGGLVAWDLRSPGVAWRMQSDLRHGFTTSMCMDPGDCWLAIGTSHGKHCCWDLRFRLPIASIDHPTKSRVRKVICHPSQPSWILSSVQGNNEVSLWNLETGFRQSVLWASSAPPLSNTQVSSHSVCAMYAGCVDRTGFLLAGGSDQRVRFWNLDRPEESSLIIPAPNDTLCTQDITYKSRLIDGTSVVQEVLGAGGPTSAPSGRTGGSVSGSSEESPRPGPDAPPAGHLAPLAEVTLVRAGASGGAGPCSIVTASRDGVIKLWK